MSPLVTRPSLPEPGTVPASTPDSAESFRTDGASGASATLAAAGAAAAAGTALAAGGAAAAVFAAGAAPAPSLIRPRIAPTATVSPSFAAISLSTPAAGAGTSIVTLSVSSSTSGSSTATASPAFLNHLPMVASVTDSPSVGTRISAIDPSSSRPRLKGRRCFARLCRGHPRLCLSHAVRTWPPGTRPGMTAQEIYPRASSKNCLSCARCSDICPTAVEADAGRPA